MEGGEDCRVVLHWNKRQRRILGDVAEQGYPIQLDRQNLEKKGGGCLHGDSAGPLANGDSPIINRKA